MRINDWSSDVCSSDLLKGWMDAKGHAGLDAFTGRAVPNVTDWQYLNLNYVAKARIDQDLCIKCGRCHIACEDTSHQAITAMVDGIRHFEVIDADCVGCKLCVHVCTRSEEHKSELQSLMRNTYAVFSLTNKK